jgi:hypothetical protein
VDADAFVAHDDIAEAEDEGFAWGGHVEFIPFGDGEKEGSGE